MHLFLKYLRFVLQIYKYGLHETSCHRIAGGVQTGCKIHLYHILTRFYKKGHVEGRRREDISSLSTKGLYCGFLDIVFMRRPATGLQVEFKRVGKYIFTTS